MKYLVKLSAHHIMSDDNKSIEELGCYDLKAQNEEELNEKANTIMELHTDHDGICRYENLKIEIL